VKLSVLKRSIAAGVLAVVVVALAWAIGFRVGTRHTNSERDCARCHDDGREGWQRGTPK